MLMLKLIVFDWDGTLADSVIKIWECKKFLARKYNLPEPSEETVRGVLGTKFEDAMTKCFPDAAQEILHQLGEEFHVLMQQENYQAGLFPDAREVMDKFKKQNIRLAVATSKDRKEIDKAILHNSLSDMFDLICCGKEHQEKPHPAMLEYIMRKYDVEPDECVMIGDTTTDISFARNADVKAIAVTFGAHSSTKLQSMNPSALIDEWMQLSRVIEKCYLNQVYSRS